MGNDDRPNDRKLKPQIDDRPNDRSTDCWVIADGGFIDSIEKSAIARSNREISKSKIAKQSLIQSIGQSSIPDSGPMALL